MRKGGWSETLTQLYLHRPKGGVHGKGDTNRRR